MKKIRIRLPLALLMVPLVSNATTFVVTNTLDSGIGSLRQAIINANLTAGSDVIQFNIPGAGTHTIAPLSPLPSITGPLLIDGTSQPGFAGAPLIELMGTQAGPTANGLAITAGNSAVAGLIINRFANAGISVLTGGTNFIAGNYIGTDTTGGIARGNLIGISINGGLANTIGSSDLADRNVISGNSDRGLLLMNTTGNVIAGNLIGTDVHGTTRLGNASHGLMLQSAPANTIGGTSPGEANVISANSGNGVYMVFSASNVVQGNLIGTDISGRFGFGNGLCGINLFGAAQNTIGGTEAGSRNLISGNNFNGIELSATGSTGNVVQGNLIGTDLQGAYAIANFNAGVFLGDAPGNLIGTSDLGARNVISGNGNGIFLQGKNATGNSVEGNFIGTDATGNAAVANGNGVVVDAAPSNAIGTVDAGNLISGNNGAGIALIGPTSTGNSIEGNLIGTDSAGGNAVANHGAGISISGAPENTIGGTGLASRNIISGNQSSGISIAGSAAAGNVIQGNFVGTDLAGRAPVGNGLSGISIADAPLITIGGTETQAGNIISGNLASGINLGGTGHVVQGNFIGTDVAGTTRLPNHSGGIVAGGSDHTIGSDTSPGQNIISGNTQAGIALSGARNCTVFGNRIGTDVTGLQALGNTGHGLLLENGAQNNTIGGTSLSEANIIGANGAVGVLLRNSTTSSNVLLGNFIGLSLSTTSLPNGLSGVAISDGAHDNVLGGVGEAEGNHIAYNLASGVLVTDSSTAGNSIRGNSIFSNGGLGLNLRPPGEPAETVTPNDPLDADTGPNGLQNYPVLTNVTYSAGLAIIQGYLRSTPNRTFELDFFSNTRTEPTGFGEGETFHPLLDSSVDTDETGYGEFTFQISGSFSNQYFTVNATDLTTSNTSEFSEAKGGLRITVVQKAGANVAISFTTSLGSNYRLDRTDTLSGSPIPWMPVTNAATVAGTGNIVTVTDPGAASLPMRHYRAQLLP